MSIRKVFVSEIQKIMHGCGDYINPLRQSAIIIELILRQQMNSMLVQLSTTAKWRNSEHISYEDILFLMRTDKVKLRRLLKYIKYKDDQDNANSTFDLKLESVVASSTGDIKEKAVTANLTCDVKKEPVIVNSTCDTEEKPLLVNETCNAKEKPVLVNETYDVKAKPMLANATCNSKEKYVITNSTKEPVTVNSTSDTKDGPIAANSTCDVKEEPIPILENQTIIMLDIKEDTEVKPKIPLKTRIDDCLKFLRYIDQTEELCNLLDDKQMYDEIEFERLIMQKQLTLSLDQAQYLDFEEERRSTFITEIFTARCFEEWLYQDHVTELRATELALEMIGYLAHETVATIIDLCLLVKRDRKMDRLERIEPVPICNTGYPTLQIFNYVPSDDDDDDYYYPPSTNIQQKNQIKCEPKPVPPSPPPPPRKVLKRRKKFRHPNCISPYDLQEVILRFYNQKSFFLSHGDLDRIQAAKQLFCC